MAHLQKTAILHLFFQYTPFSDTLSDVAVAAEATIVYPTSDTFNLEGECSQAADSIYPYELDDDDMVDGSSSTMSKQWLIVRLRERTAEWSNHDGEVTEVNCVWFRDTVCHAFSQIADWYSEFEKAVREVLEEVEEVREEDRQLRTREDAQKLQRLANEMAHHPRYAEATNDAKRQYMAEQLFTEVNPLESRRIATLAALIHWWDIEPDEL